MLGTVLGIKYTCFCLWKVLLKFQGTHTSVIKLIQDT